MTNSEGQMVHKWCTRCWTGKDTDGDGNCPYCARLTDEQAAEIRAKAPMNPDNRLQGYALHNMSRRMGRRK